MFLRLAPISNNLLFCSISTQPEQLPSIQFTPCPFWPMTNFPLTFPTLWNKSTTEKNSSAKTWRKSTETPWPRNRMLSYQENSKNLSSSLPLSYLTLNANIFCSTYWEILKSTYLKHKLWSWPCFLIGIMRFIKKSSPMWTKGKWQEN